MSWKRLLAFCRCAHPVSWERPKQWRADSRELGIALERDGFRDNYWLCGPIPPWRKIAGLLPIALFGYVFGSLASALTVPVIALVLLVLVGVPTLVASAFYVRAACGPVVIRRPDGFELGSRSEGLHRVAWTDVARWARAESFGTVVYWLDLGDASPLVTRVLVLPLPTLGRRAAPTIGL
ncbi:hypothetical protein [Sandaracinus amylolyticus]|uniref:hypothetical protein n=1 Tax=Sandaracinus amylolyticus TaxID=927083 RepID=UPI001F3898D0|nr:hypothetical protein [Sandaracinus amylolyticus]UJR83689.1 Hypothetical protein I5071_57580 [Sandaracinus amylolyticus]